MYAFSGPQGEWSIIDIPHPDQRADPVATGNVLAFTNGNHAFAISATNGQWQSLEFPSVPSPPITMVSSVRVDAGSRIGLFSIQTGTWAVMDLEVD